MIFNMVGGGGGSDTSVNFRVIGSPTRPDTAKDNDIWVETSEPIRGWEISEDVEIPTTDTSRGVTQGFVHIAGTYVDAYDAKSSDGFNKMIVVPSGSYSGTVYTKLVKCKQYRNNRWYRVNAYIYHPNVGWTQFSVDRVYLYKNGDQCTALTGGWEKKAYGGSTTYVRFNTGNIELESPTATVIVGLKNTTQTFLADYDYICMLADISYRDEKTPSGYVGLLSTYTLGTSGIDSKWIARTRSGDGTNVTVSAKISDVSSGYVGVGAYQSITKVYSVWLE